MTHDIINRLGEPWRISREDPVLGSYVTGFGSQICTKDQWKALKKRIDRYYNQVPQNFIEQYNADLAAFKVIRLAPEDEDADRAMWDGVTPRPGYIYLIHAYDTPWFKIGVSCDPYFRVKQLGTRMPFLIQVVGFYPSANMYLEEKEWHDRFHFRQVEGEWFELLQQEVALFLDKCQEANNA